MKRSDSTLRIFAACTMPLCLAAVTGAQSLADYAQADITTPVTAVGLASNAIIGKAIHGDFDVSGYQEMVAMSGGTLIRLEDCATFAAGALVPIGETVLNITTVAGSVPGARSRVGVLTASGLRVWSYSANTGWSSVLVNDTAWIGARAFVSADVNNDTSADIVGLNSAGTLILRAYSINGVFTPQAPIALSSAATQIAVADIDGDGPKEIGLIEGSQFQVRKNDGSVLYTASMTKPGVAVTTLKRNPASGALPEQFVVASGDAGVPNHSIYVMGTSSEGPIALQNVTVLALDGADCDGDGYDDLFINRADTRSPQILQRSASLPTFAPGTLTKYVNVSAGSQSPGNNVTYACCADFDRDGKADVELYSANAPNFELRPAVPLPPATNLSGGGTGPLLDLGHPAIYYAEYPVNAGGAQTFAYSLIQTPIQNPPLYPPASTAPANTLRLWLDLSAWTLTGPGAPNAIEVFVYKRSLNASMIDTDHPEKLYYALSTAGHADPLDTFHQANFSPAGSTAPWGPGHRDPSKLIWIDVPTYYASTQHPPSSPSSAMTAGEWGLNNGNANNYNYRMYFYVRALTVAHDLSTSNVQRKYYGSFALSLTQYNALNADTSLGIYGGAGSHFPFDRDPPSSSNNQGAEIKIGGFVAISSIPQSATPESWPLVIDIIGSF